MRKLVTFSLYFIFLSYWLHCHFCYRDIVVREVVWIGGVRCQVSKRIKSCGVEKSRLRVREFHEDHQHQLQNINRMEASQVIMVGSWCGGYQGLSGGRHAAVWPVSELCADWSWRRAGAAFIRRSWQASPTRRKMMLDLGKATNTKG